MKPKLARISGVVMALALIVVPAFAHHGGSEYDRDHPITLKGTVKQFYWANPHPQIFIDVKGQNGKVVDWGVEALAPAVLRRAGWSPSTLKPGDQVTLTVAPSKRGTPFALLQKALLTDGRELTAGHLGEQ